MLSIYYENYYGNRNKIFKKDSGISQFINLKVVSDYSVKKIDSIDNKYRILLKQKLINTSNDTIKELNFILHFPCSILSKGMKEPQLLYDLLSYNVTGNVKHSKIGRADGFGNGTGSNSSEITYSREIFLPGESVEFSYSSEILTRFYKFEIYPLFYIKFHSRGERIWPSSRIIIDGKKCKPKKEYIRVCNLVSSSFLVFCFNQLSSSVKDCKEVVPTFTPFININE